MNTFMDRVNVIVQKSQAPINPMAAAPNVSYPDTGMGALENVANGVPRQTMIGNQPHMLAYINPQEEGMLQDYRNDTPVLAGPDGVPAYWFHSGGGRDSGTTTSEPDNDPEPSGWDNFVTGVKTAATNIGTGIKDTFTGGGSDDSGSGGYIGDLVSGGGSDNKGNLGVLGDIGGAIGDAVGVTSYYDDPENDVTGTGEIITTELPAVGTSVVPVIFKDRFGKEHATQAAADAADAVVTSDDVAANITSVNATPEKKVAENSWRETFANLLTKGDSAFYKGGTLYGYDKDGKVIDLTGGGETFNRVTGLSNYVYGVSDNEATGTAIDTTGMSQTEKNAALAKQQMIYDIAPNDLAYFASFLPNLATNMIPGVLGEISGVASFFGGSLGDLMLKGGIEERRAIVAAETAALEAGAEPRYNENGEYIGHDNNVLNELAGGLAGQDAINATVGYVVNEAIDNAVASNPGSSYDGNVDLDGDGIGTIYTDTNGNNMFDEGESTFATDNIYEDYPMIDSKGSYVEAMEEQASNDNNTTVTTSSGDGSDGGSDRAAVAASIFKRYYRGGSGAGLPEWLRKYASGATINQLLEKVTVEGEVYYKTTDKPPKYIKEIELAGAVDLGVEEPSANNEE